METALAIVGLAALVIAAGLHADARRMLREVHACNADFAEALRLLEAGRDGEAEALLDRWRASFAP